MWITYIRIGQNKISTEPPAKAEVCSASTSNRITKLQRTVLGRESAEGFNMCWKVILRSVSEDSLIINTIGKVKVSTLPSFDYDSALKAAQADSEAYVSLMANHTGLHRYNTIGHLTLHSGLAVEKAVVL